MLKKIGLPIDTFATMALQAMSEIENEIL